MLMCLPGLAPSSAATESDSAGAGVAAAAVSSSGEDTDSEDDSEDLGERPSQPKRQRRGTHSKCNTHITSVALAVHNAASRCTAPFSLILFATQLLLLLLLLLLLQPLLPLQVSTWELHHTQATYMPL